MFSSKSSKLLKSSWLAHNNSRRMLSVYINQLERLVFSPNAKCTRRVSADECRVAVRHLIPTLRALDGVEFTAAEAAVAAKGAPPCARKPRWGGGGGGAADAVMPNSARRPPLQVRALDLPLPSCG